MKAVAVTIDFHVLKAIISSMTDKLNMSELSDKELHSVMNLIEQEDDIFPLIELPRLIKESILQVAEEETKQFILENS